MSNILFTTREYGHAPIYKKLLRTAADRAWLKCECARLCNGSHLRSVYTIDRSFEMTSFSVKDILNLPEAGLCPSKSETTHESSASYHSPGGNTRTSSCGSVVCNQGQECSYTSKNELDFVSLIERKVNAGLHEVLNSIAGKILAANFREDFFCKLRARWANFSHATELLFRQKIQWCFLRGN